MGTHRKDKKKVSDLITLLRKPLSVRDQLIAFIKTLLKKHPPSSDSLKNTRIAYQAYLDAGFKKILYKQWRDIYKPGRSAEEMADNVLNAPKTKPSKIAHTSWGKVPKIRKLSDELKLYANAQYILFNTDQLLKEWDIKMEPSQFLALISLDFMGHESIDKYDLKTQGALSYCRAVLTNVESRFIMAYHPEKRKHQEVIALLFGKNHSLAKDVTGKGKRVTHQSFYKAVKEIQRLFTREAKMDSTRDYTDKKFYYLAWLASHCNIHLPIEVSMFPERIKARAEIEKILKPFNPSARLKITRGAIEMLNFQESEGYIRLLTELVNKKKPS